LPRLSPNQSIRFSTVAAVVGAAGVVEVVVMAAVAEPAGAAVATVAVEVVVEAVMVVEPVGGTAAVSLAGAVREVRRWVTMGRPSSRACLFLRFQTTLLPTSNSYTSWPRALADL